MLCDKCKQRPATVHFVKIMNNEKFEQNLCEECSKGITNFGFGIDTGFSLNKFLANLLTHDPVLANMGNGFDSEKCENCGLTYNQFSQGGKLGCSNCYGVFQEKINPLLRRIHSSEKHTGKVPERTGGKLKILKELESLKTEMGLLVSKEEFEKAAEVRDKIKNLENKMVD